VIQSCSKSTAAGFSLARLDPGAAVRPWDERRGGQLVLEFSRQLNRKKQLFCRIWTQNTLGCGSNLLQFGRVSNVDADKNGNQRQDSSGNQHRTSSFSARSKQFSRNDHAGLVSSQSVKAGRDFTAMGGIDRQRDARRRPHQSRNSRHSALTKQLS
jgi:hypothetical protein